MKRRKSPLYRKVNTCTHNVFHHYGEDYRQKRNGKRAEDTAMKQGIHRGLDYTPLFRFLLAKAGCEWNKVYSEVKARLDREEPIFWMVTLNREQAKEIVRISESTYFSGLFVDEQGLLQITAPHITPETLSPSCACCTHTFNGVRFSKKYHADQK